MGRRELLEALHREGEETRAAIARDSAVAGEELRASAGERCARLRREQEEERERLCRERTQRLLAKAAHEAALIRLRAEDALAHRLHARACLALRDLGSAAAEELFRTLAAELPTLPWATIRIAPGDERRAAALFPAATLIVDPAISAGLKVASADQHLTIDNTLETRLERLWPDLLPQLIAELRGEER